MTDSLIGVICWLLSHSGTKENDYEIEDKDVSEAWLLIHIILIINWFIETIEYKFLVNSDLNHKVNISRNSHWSN